MNLKPRVRVSFHGPLATVLFHTLFLHDQIPIKGTFTTLEKWRKKGMHQHILHLRRLLSPLVPIGPDPYYVKPLSNSAVNIE